jgi:hypothetical protein
MVSQADGEAIITQLEVPVTVSGELQGATSFQLDGDFDNGIIAHEYGHGISNRLTGGRNNVGCLNNAEQMGEGWSDYIGLMMTMEAGDARDDIRGIGTYAIGEPTNGGGIRPAPYSTDFAVNNYTYGDTNSGLSQPHGIGFVWATVLWEMTWDLIDKYGFDSDLYTGTGGNNIAMQLVTEGMKLQACDPGFVDGRDGILAADQALYGGANQCLIWKAFARRGLGFSASQGNRNSRSDQVEAFDLPGTTWAAGSWSNGAPTRGYSVVFNDNYDTSTDGNVEACSCTVNAGQTVRVEAGDHMLIDEDITVDGTLIVEHQGSLVQVDGSALATNNGLINVNLTTPTLDRDDWMALGSPMTAETRADGFGPVRRVMYHIPSNFTPNPGVGSTVTNFQDADRNFWRTLNSGGSLNPGEGYLVFPVDSDGSTRSLTFDTGTLNNGDVTHALVYNGASNPNGTPNILSNPYASPVDADAFLSANAGISELYFWEHLTAPDAGIPGPYDRNYSMDDISVYNLSGGTAAANDGTGTATAPNGVISTFQGFGVRASANGTATFTNAMRLTTGNTTLRQGERLDDRLWLRLSSDAYDYPLGSNVLIAFNPVASAGMDPGYDTDRLDSSVSLYSQIEGTNKQLSIQTREGFDQDIKVSLGMSSYVTDSIEYIISLTQVEGSNLEGRGIYLVDNLLGVITDLSEEDYRFRGGQGDQPGRFTLQFEYEVLSTAEVLADQIGLYPNPTDGLLNIVAPGVGINSVSVYDLQGRLVTYEQINVNNVFQLDVNKLNTAVYLLVIDTDRGELRKQFVKR